MKKFILVLALISGINVSIESSYSTYFLKGAKGAGLFLTAAAGTMAGNLLNDSKINQLNVQVGELAKNNVILTHQFGELIKNNNILRSQLSSLTTKEGSFFDKFGTAGLVLSALFTGYRYAQYGLSELQGLFQILNAAKYVARVVKGKNEENELYDHQPSEALQEQLVKKSDHRFDNMTPQQKSELLKKYGLDG